MMRKSNSTEALNGRACEACRRKKRKCTFEKPSCYLCRCSKIECVYESRKRKPGPPRGTKRLRNLDLLARITTLETMIKETPPTANHITDDGTTSHLSPDEPLTESSANEAEIALWCNPSPTAHLTHLAGDTSSSITQHGECTNGTQLSEALQLNLLELYFDHIQPAFPLFRRPNFFDQFASGLVPAGLLSVMMALAARFSPYASAFRHLNLGAWEALVNRSLTDRSTRTSMALDLNAVKKECLITLYEYTRSPDLRAWKQASVMTRVAIGYGLHLVDDHHTRDTMGEDLAEECRFVWWTIWKLDGIFNGIALTPMCIDERVVNTFLVSTAISDFTAGHTRLSSRTYLDLSITGLEQCLRRADCTDSVVLQRLDTYVAGLIRTHHALRCHASKAPEAYREGLKHMKSTCYIFATCVPGWFLDPRRNSEKLESSSDHRTRLMVLLQYNVLRLNCHLPSVDNDEGGSENLDMETWQQCVAFAQDFVALFRCWDPSYDTRVDPMATCAMWYVCVVLAIQAMSVRLVSIPTNGERGQVEVELAYMISTLRRFSNWWPLAKELQSKYQQDMRQFPLLNTFSDSIEQLWTWSWLDIDWAGMQELVEQLRTLLDPKSPEPSRIHVSFAASPHSTSGSYLPTLGLDDSDLFLSDQPRLEEN